jgi:4TM region of DNA translocase FtsK/SpoIIIE
MLENRNLKLDLLALALLAAVIFLAAALFSYDPADPPGKLVFPQHAHAANVCGYWGALSSRWLFEALGLGAYYLLVSLAVLDAVLLTRREAGQPCLRAAEILRCLRRGWHDCQCRIPHLLRRGTTWGTLVAGEVAAGHHRSKAGHGNLPPRVDGRH